jgi:hypothetical protein
MIGAQARIIPHDDEMLTTDQTKGFGDTAKSLARNPLGIVALFIVMVYGFASLVTAFAGSFTAAE